MKIELIPVIEITNYDHDIKLPDNGPFWKYPEDWEKFNLLSNRKAGFKEDLIPYLKGSSLYKISEITDNNLAKLVVDETQEMRDNDDDRDLCSAFSGGYVLRINDEDKIFPQCCSSLACIKNWQGLLTGQQGNYYQGHPAPVISFKDNYIIFDLTISEADYDKFVPPPIETLIKVEREYLAIAIVQALNELHSFSIRLNKININKNLNIFNIGNLLIFGQYD